MRGEALNALEVLANHLVFEIEELRDHYEDNPLSEEEATSVLSRIDSLDEALEMLAGVKHILLKLDGDGEDQDELDWTD